MLLQMENFEAIHSRNLSSYSLNSSQLLCLSHRNWCENQLYIFNLRSVLLHGTFQRKKKPEEWLLVLHFLQPEASSHCFSKYLFSPV